MTIFRYSVLFQQFAKRYFSSTCKSCTPSSAIPTRSKVEDAFTIDYYYENITDHCYEDDSINVTFKELGVAPRMCHILSREGLTKPTPIQKRSLPHTLQTPHRPCMIQSETGTGKTLTYLIPAVKDTRPGVMGTLVVTPTRELAVQVFHVAKKLAGNHKHSRRVGILFSGTTEDCLMDEFYETKPHILIGTAKILYRLLETDPAAFNACRRLILDEGDILLKSPSRFAPDKALMKSLKHQKPTRLIVEHLMKKDVIPSLICTSATIPKMFREELKEIGWTESPKIISTVSQMTIPKGITHGYVLCKNNIEGNKISSLVKHFQERNVKQALVFIHRDISINDFVEELKTMGIRARPLYKEVIEIGNYHKFLKSFKNGDIEIVVGTEETVRGLDFTFVETLYLMEVPRNANEYLHLAGRVGRIYNKGLVVTFVGEEKRDFARLQRLYKTLRINGTSLDTNVEH